MMGRIFHTKVRQVFFLITLGLVFISILFFGWNLYSTWAPRNMVKRALGQYQVNYPDLKFSLGDYQVHFSKNYEVELKNLVLTYKKSPLLQVDSFLLKIPLSSLWRKSYSFEGKAKNIFTYSHQHLIFEKEFSKIFKLLEKKKTGEFSWEKWIHRFSENKKITLEIGTFSLKKERKRELDIKTHFSLDFPKTKIKGYGQSHLDLEQWIDTGQVWAVTEQKIKKIIFDRVETRDDLNQKFSWKTLLGRNGDFKWELEAKGEAFLGRLKGELSRSEARLESLGFWVTPYLFKDSFGRFNKKGKIHFQGSWVFPFRERQVRSTLMGKPHKLLFEGVPLKGEISLSPELTYWFKGEKYGLHFLLTKENDLLIEKNEKENIESSWLKNFLSQRKIKARLVDIPMGAGKCSFIKNDDNLEGHCERASLEKLSEVYPFPWGKARGHASLNFKCLLQGKCDLKGESKEVLLPLFSINPYLKKVKKVRIYKDRRFSQFSFQWEKESLLGLHLKNRVYDIEGEAYEDGFLLTLQGKKLFYLLNGDNWEFKEFIND